MKKIIIKIVSVLMLGVTAFASPASLPARAVIKGGEKAAAKLGLRAAGEGAVHGGAKLAAVTAERAVAKRAAGGAVENVAKHVTAKQLLAAGAGTAMVVAAHETADGVQQMGEGVKEAVAANPELAKDVAEAVTVPIRYAVAICCAALVAILVWFIWPLAAIGRNWIRLAASRRAAAKRGTVPAADVIEVEPLPSASGRSGFTRVELILMAAGFLLMSVIGVWRIARSGNSDVTSPFAPGAATRLQEQVATRAKKVERLQSEYAAALDRHYAEFLSEVESVTSARFGRVRAGIPGAVEKFGTFSRCKDLLVTLVKDKMDKGTRTRNSITRDLEADFYRGLYGAHDAAEACMVAFLKKAEASRQSFRQELQVELDSVELPGDEAFKVLLADGGERIEKSKRELAEGQVVAAISAVVEATCIRFTVSTVAKLLGKSAARIAGSVAVGAGTALADGPLPIGDIVGGVLVIGSSCWSAYDIYQATKVLPSKLRSSLEATARQCERQTLEEMKNAGESIYRAYSTGKTLDSCASCNRRVENRI